MKNDTLLQKLEIAIRTRNIKKYSTDSYNWYRDQARKLSTQISKDKIQNSLIRQQKSTPNPRIGDIVCFGYDAKTKAKLPYWDAFPMIIFVGPAEGGFYGINLHYLSPKYRALFFDRLQNLLTNRRYDSTTRIRVSYDFLMKSSRLKLFAPCFKHYLFSQVKTRVVKIDPSEWEAALYLPIADFRKASNSKVWSDSIINA